MKRYKIVIQHEVIIYEENDELARNRLLNNPDMKLRTNLQCISVTEIPLPEHEPARQILDKRTAPGS
jgi:hypothetical protein